MAQTSRAKNGTSSGQVDRISALPDGILEHVLGFLPAHEAVQTSLLAPRWRELWKSMRRLNITNSREGFISNDFIPPLLLLRDPRTTLDEVKFAYSSHFVDQIDIWIRHTLLCQARVVIVSFPGEFDVTLKNPPLNSRYLKRLELTSVVLEGDFLNFARCPALDVLEIKDCGIYPERIVSKSVRHLRIEDTTFYSAVRTRISVPSLIWLHLENVGGKAPLLESMPSLTTAFLEPAYKGEDYCDKGDSKECCAICEDCCGRDGQEGRCVLLGGMSNATNLTLLAYPGTFILRRDLRWCPIFCNLKKLVLNNWCVAIDLRALVCILEHSPVLQDLTLQLHKGPIHIREMEGNNSLMEKSASISKQLKVIKVKCEEVDERVWKILKFLSMLDIEITIKRMKNVC
ncbi:hypothetical protein ACP70R_003815 [Stipagrostis hirtigluma subsp. patula]